MTLNDEALIKKDRLRYSKNKLSANLTYLSIVFDVLYYISLYSSDIKRQQIGTSYYVWMMGISVLYNLIFLLAAFLCSEGVKNYSSGHGYALMVIGALQVVRIFIWPLKLHNTKVGSTEELVMQNGQFVLVIVYLLASAGIAILAGVIAVLKTKTLRDYEAELKRKGSES